MAAVKKWSTYLRAATKVEILTDHNPLCWLREQKDPRHTYAWWLLELEEVPYEISYRPAKEESTPRLPQQGWILTTKSMMRSRSRTRFGIEYAESEFRSFEFVICKFIVVHMNEHKINKIL